MQFAAGRFAAEDSREALRVIQRVDFLLLLHGQLAVVQNVRANERVAAHDVFIQRGQQREMKLDLKLAG